MSSSDKEYLAPHLRKDVHNCNAVIIALTASLSAICGASAAILTAQLSYYRKEPPIGGYWMAGLLFVSPGLTGMILGYKRRVMSLSSHLGVSLISTVLGGVAVVYSIMNIYQDTCTPYPFIGECHKIPLMLLCISSLIGAGSMCAISLLVTIYTYNKVLDHQKRVAAEREREAANQASAPKKKKEREQRAHENIAMDVNSPDRLSAQNSEVEFSSYL